MTFGCDKSLLRQSYLLLMLPYVPKIKVPEKGKFQRNNFASKEYQQEKISYIPKEYQQEKISYIPKEYQHEKISYIPKEFATKGFSYIIHIKDIIRVQKKIISTTDIPNSFRLRASKRK